MGEGMRTTLVTVGVGGALAYGCYNREFRNEVESKAPWTKCCFDKAEQFLSYPKRKSSESKVTEKNLTKESFKPDFVALKNKELEDALICAIESAESKVRRAKESKLKTIAMTREHAALLKKAVDDRQNGDWLSVEESLKKADSLAKYDRTDEVDARNALDALKKLAYDGKICVYTNDNKLIVLAMETAKKLNKQIDEMNLLAESARARSAVMTQYRVLVEKSRKQFADQLHKISPHIDAQDDKMTNEEAQEVIALTRAEVDALYRQLIEKQLESEQKLASAIDDQRKALSKIAKQDLESEQERVRRTNASKLSPDIMASREAWQKELQERLTRAALAHEQHMQQIDEAVHRERRRHARQIGRSQSKLDAMELALANRSDMDSLNRRLRYCWLACQNLVNSIVYGRQNEDSVERRRFPLAAQLGIIQEAYGKAGFIKLLISLFPNNCIFQGAYTHDDLKQRFKKVENVIRSVAYVHEQRDGPFMYGLSYLRSKLRIEPHNKFSSFDKIDLSTIDINEIMDRAKYFVQRNDLKSAIRLLQLLKGLAASLARDWIRDAREHLEAKMLADAIVAHSTVNGIRTTY
ncbi:unnamed protein product [Anisakis simplex]|uniref:MICOS complex subunit MIC60 n=1 Tax=Anisakis simplex TaxID=6269 RepID=A0A0M3JVY7_ANISI|nr:unnamed protein product [Anisakis simplex]